LNLERNVSMWIYPLNIPRLTGRARATARFATDIAKRKTNQNVEELKFHSQATEDVDIVE